LTSWRISGQTRRCPFEVGPWGQKSQFKEDQGRGPDQEPILWNSLGRNLRKKCQWKDCKKCGFLYYILPSYNKFISLLIKILLPFFPKFRNKNTPKLPPRRLETGAHTPFGPNWLKKSTLHRKLKWLRNTGAAALSEKKLERSRVHGPFLTSPLGANFDPRGGVVPWGWCYPLGVKSSVHPSILLNSRECSPLGVNEGVNISPRRQISPLGVNFTQWPSALSEFSSQWLEHHTIYRSTWPGANPTIASYNASVVNFYNATGSLVRFENKNIFFYF
jgi:hypothetical protein